MKYTWRRKLTAWIMILVVMFSNAGSWIPRLHAQEEEAASGETTTYTISVSGGAGTFYYQVGENYIPIEGGSVSLVAGTYQIRYIGSQEHLVAVNGTVGEQAVAGAVTLFYDTVQHIWNQQWDGSLSLQTDAALTAREDILALTFENAANAVMPDVEYQLGICAATGETIYNLEQVPSYVFRVKDGIPSDVELAMTQTKNQASFKYLATTEPIADELEIEAVDSTLAGEGSNVEETPQASFSKKIPILHTDILYGRDYECASDTGMYMTKQAGTAVLFHDGKMKSIKIKKNRYTAYRYKDQESVYPSDFVSFDERETEHVVVLGSGSLYLQMKNTDAGSEAFGSTGEIRVIADQEAPQVVVYKNHKAVSTDSNRPILLKADDVLTIGASEDQNGSGIDRITRVIDGTEETIQSMQTMQYQLETAAIPCVEGRQRFTYRVYDHVGNMRELEFLVDVDGVKPEITVDAVWAVQYGDEEVYYMNASDQAALSVTFQDEHLDVETIRVSGPVQRMVTADMTEGACQIDYAITGSGTVEWTVQDTHGNQTCKQIQVVYDHTMPQIEDASVRLHDADPQITGMVHTPYDTTYQAEAFHQPLIDFQVTEAHLLKIEIMAEHQDEKITLQPNTPQGDTYTYQDVSLENLDAFAEERLHIYVYDKAGNITDYQYQNAYAGKVTYIKSGIQWNTVGIGNTVRNLRDRKYIVPDQGKIHMQITASGELLLPQMLWVHLYQVDDQGNPKREVAQYRYDGTGGIVVDQHHGNWNISCDYQLQADDTDAYIIQVSYMDIAENEIITKTSDVYYIDQEPVQLTAASKQTVSGGRAGQNVQVVYTMHEKNPDFSTFVYTYTSSLHSITKNPADVWIVKPDGTREQVAITELTTRICDESVWRQDQDEYTLTLEYADQSIYTTALTVRDIMGTAATARYDFRIDKTAPQLESVDVKTDYENRFYSTFNRFDTDSAVITLRLKDEVSNADELSVVCVAKDQLTAKEQRLQGVLGKDEKGQYTYLLTIKKNFKGTLLFEISDGYHTTTTEHIKYADGVVLEDKTMHEDTSALSITASKANVYGFYRTDVILKLSAKDSYSGIKKIGYSVNGKYVSESFEKESQIRTDWEKSSVLLNADKVNEGNAIPITLTMEDNAGNQSELTKHYKIDITKPVIRVAFDQSQPLHEKYYKTDRIATITIQELNYDASSTVVTVYRDGKAMSVTPHFKSDGTIGTTEDGVSYKKYQMQLPFTEDGEYTFEISTTDMAGNKSQYTYQDSFVIDHTLPAISLEFDNQTPYKEQYYGESRTATLIVREHNFDPSAMEVLVTASHNGTKIAAPQIGRFVSDGDVHKAVLSFVQEGDYTISVQGKDLAGNQAQEIPEQTFTIDLSAPEIEITGVEQNKSYNRAVRPVVRILDDNYDAGAVHIQITGGRHGTLSELSPQIASSEREYVYTYQDLRYLRDYDDCYTIVVTATDLAGHVTTKNVDYRVNRFGSAYTCSEALQNVLDTHYGTTSENYSIVETNVDQLKDYQLAYTLDGEIVNLEEGKDYTVVASRTQDNWYRYEYRLAAGVFVREGNYAVSVSSTDASGNISDNRACRTLMEFCIDNTAPSCIISGVSNGQKFDREADIHIGVEVYDNTEIRSTRVILNGTQIASLEDFENGRLMELAIDRSIRHQSLQVISVDAAGNEREENVSFTCVQEGDRIAVVIWILLATGIAGLACAIVMIRRGKSPGHK